MIKSYAGAFILGAVLVFGLAPFDYTIFSFIAFSLFLCLFEYIGAKQAQKKTIFLLGFSFGLGYFSFGLYWLYYAFLVLYNGDIYFIIYAALSILCLSLFFAFLSLYWGLTTLICNYISSNLYMRIFSFSLCLAMSEYLRGHLFTGFPWNLVGYCLTPNILLMQISSIFNIYILSFFAVFIFSSPAILIYKGINKKNLCFISLAFLIFSLDIAYGYLKLKNAPNLNQHYKSEYVISLIQPNIEQKQKLNEKYAAKNFYKLIDLIHSSNKPYINLIICPETAIDFLLKYNSQAKNYIKNSLYPGQLMILGAPRLGENNKIYNSALLLNSDAKLLAYSDKIHLVPFGEYLPFKSFLPNINIFSDYSPGKSRYSIALNKNLNYLSLICYEAIFPDELKYRGPKANFIVNITNDAWYGFSSGPFQHFRQAQLRAIEQHLPLIRVGNNGISAVIDSYGRIVKKLGLNKSGAIVVSIPYLFETL